ncbi:hypothetical protein [Burkholderia sp. JKS000303]|uniref:hypothetical protein n=1 Tax=Burkholderia sp. JKS000303 TaxID=1938747 RepID=UPI000BF7B371|nr:hypothetical protein [Burkholderia sp. JKS000303]PFH29160.1 hypothetical protein BX604_2932 [Burkholderia sp. JKS000303]
MKNLMLLAAGIVASIAIVACNSLPTVQQQFQTGCTIVNGDLAILATSPLLNVDQRETISGVPGDPTKPGILPVNQAICKAGAQLNVTDLKAFHDTLLPAAIGIVQAIPALPNQPAILLGLQTFGPMVQALIDQIITAAGVPAAASTPLAGSAIQ